MLDRLFNSMQGHSYNILVPIFDKCEKIMAGSPLPSQDFADIYNAMTYSWVNGILPDFVMLAMANVSGPKYVEAVTCVISGVLMSGQGV